MKISGIIITLLSSFFFSGQVSRFYNRRCTYVKTLLFIITDIRHRISYSPEDIFSLCGTYSEEKYFPFDKVFSECADGGDALLSALRNGLDRIYELDDEVKDVVFTAFDGLTHSSLSGAVGHITLCEERLKDICEKSETEKMTKGKMYEKLVMLFGIFITVILI